MNEPNSHRRKAEELFQRVVSLTAEEQRAYLEAHCRDTALRAEVEKLLDYDRAHPADPTVDVVPQTPAVGVHESAPGRGDRPIPSPPRPTSSSAEFGHGRFLPGTVVGERYRIVGLLGRGGMGEVYRADDLELGQSVALKFLPERLARDQAALERFRGEVRLARQVSHPNVCRVYDVGQVDGHYRCLEADPARRPSSAVLVAAALPGGDPLQAALAAGETPSPAMVAEAGATEGMHPALALACLLGFVAVVIGISAVRPRTLAERVSLDNSPEVLRVRAKDIVGELGYTDLPEHVASGFTINRSYLRFVAEQDGTAARWEALANERPSAVLFWHRWNPSALHPTGIHKSFIDADDPPQFLPGSLSVRLDKNVRSFATSSAARDSRPCGT